MIKPYYSHAGIEIYHGDCLELIEQLTPVHALVTDPPYGLDVEFGRNNSRVIGDSSTELRDVAQALADSAAAIVFGSPKVARPQGARMTLVWDKSELTGMGDLAFPWKLTHEEIYLYGDFRMNARRDGSVLRFPLRPAWTNHPDAVTNMHPTEKPVSLMRYLIERVDGNIIDPFCGSCSTLVAAKQLNRQAIGIEISEEYCEIGARRLEQEVLSFEPVKEIEPTQESLL